MADPKIPASDMPPMNSPDAPGTPSDDKRDAVENESTGARTKPMSGGTEKKDDPLHNPLANRNPGPRKAGTTPRPTDTPID